MTDAEKIEWLSSELEVCRQRFLTIKKFGLDNEFGARALRLALSDIEHTQTLIPLTMAVAE